MVHPSTLISLLVLIISLFGLVMLTYARLRRRHAQLRVQYNEAIATMTQLQDLVAVREFQVDRLQALADIPADQRTRLMDAEAHERALESVRELIDSLTPSRSNSTNEWQQFSRPLQQVVIRLQGTWRSEPPSIFAQLDIVRARLENGHHAGYEHDDDFGYEFAFEPASQSSSFFPTPTGRR